MTFHRILHGGPVAITPIEKVSRHITVGRQDARIDLHGLLRVIDRAGERKVLLSLAKVKGYYDGHGSAQVDSGRMPNAYRDEG